MFDNDARGLESPERQTESADDCPFCGATIGAVVTRGPSTHALAPFGCAVSTLTVRALVGDLDRGRGLATDGGLAADNVLDACDICEENQGVTSEDVVNEETGEMTSVWLCSECLDRLERYNSGDEQAFQEVMTDGGRDITEWECGGCGDTFETPGEPELACLICGADDWQEVDAE